MPIFLPLSIALLVAAAVLAILTGKGMLRPLWRNRHGLIRVPWRIVLFVLFILAAVIALTLLLAPFRKLLPRAEGATALENAPLPTMILGYALLTVAILLASAAAARWLDRRPFAGIGLGLHSRWLRDLGLGLGLGALFITGVVAVQAALGALRLAPSGEAGGEILRHTVLYLLFFIGVAFVEELLFRGFALQALAEGIGKVPAALLLSAPFGFIHHFNSGGTWIGAVSTGVAGLLLCLAYFRTRSLWLPVGMHVTWNFFMGYVWSLPVSGVTLPVVPFTVTTIGPDWVSGGSFGPEGSFLSFVGMGLMALWIGRSRWFEPGPDTEAWYPPPEVRMAAAVAPEGNDAEERDRTA
ncbi:MAG: type II CAAX endopeptidase family protein [Candidatus Eisenbacteria bacterium]